MVQMAIPSTTAYAVVGIRLTGWDYVHRQGPALARGSFLSSLLGFSDLHRSIRTDLTCHHRLSRRETGATMSSVEHWRRNVLPCEKAVVDGTSMLPRRSDTGESRQAEATGTCAEVFVNLTDDSGPTRFFYDELREAAAAMKERAQAVKSLNPVLTGPTEKEGTVQIGGIADNEKSSEAKAKGAKSNWDALRELDKSRRGKLPIESNGPPMVILKPYLAPGSAQEKPKEKLKRLPLPMPHKLRPLGLPRASLRRRLSVISSRKFIATNQVDDFNTKDLAVDIQSLPVKANVSRVLKKWVWLLKKGSLAKTVRELGRMQLTERSLQVVLWLQKYPHLWPDCTTLCTVIQVMVEAGKVDTASELQRTLGRDSAKAAQTLAFALAKNGKWLEAVDVLNYMKQAGWKTDGSVHTKLIQCACRTGAKVIVESLLADTDLLELKLNLREYTTIIASCSKLGLDDRVEAVYLHFKCSGLRPDIVTYTALLAALVKAGKHTEAEELFANIGEAGCTPDLVTYEVMLELSAKLEDLDKTMKVFNDLRKAGFDPSPEAYNTLVQLHHKLGFISIANGLIQEMQSKGFHSAQALSSLSTIVVL